MSTEKEVLANICVLKLLSEVEKNDDYVLLQEREKELELSCIERAKNINRLKDETSAFLSALEGGSKTEINFKRSNLEYILRDTMDYSEIIALD